MGVGPGGSAREGAQRAEGWEDSTQGGEGRQAELRSQGQGDSPSFSAMSQPLVNNSRLTSGVAGLWGDERGRQGAWGAQPGALCPQSGAYPGRLRDWAWPSTHVITDTDWAGFKDGVRVS